MVPPTSKELVEQLVSERLYEMLNESLSRQYSTQQPVKDKEKGKGKKEQDSDDESAHSKGGGPTKGGTKFRSGSKARPAPGDEGDSSSEEDSEPKDSKSATGKGSTSKGKGPAAITMDQLAGLSIEVPKPIGTKMPTYNGSSYTLFATCFQTWATVQGIWAYFDKEVPRPTIPAYGTMEEMTAALQRRARHDYDLARAYDALLSAMDTQELKRLLLEFRSKKEDEEDHRCTEPGRGSGRPMRW